MGGMMPQGGFGGGMMPGTHSGSMLPGTHAGGMMGGGMMPGTQSGGMMPGTHTGMMGHPGGMPGMGGVPSPGAAPGMMPGMGSGASPAANPARPAGAASGSTTSSLAQLLQGLQRPTAAAPGGMPTASGGAKPAAPKSSTGTNAGGGDDALITMLRGTGTGSPQAIPDSHKAQIEGVLRKSSPPTPKAAPSEKTNLSLMELLQGSSVQAGAPTAPVAPTEPSEATYRIKPDPKAAIPLVREPTPTDASDGGMEISSLSPLTPDDEPSISRDRSPASKGFGRGKDTDPESSRSESSRSESVSTSKSFASLKLGDWNTKKDKDKEKDGPKSFGEREPSARESKRESEKAKEGRISELPPGAEPEKANDGKKRPPLSFNSFPAVDPAEVKATAAPSSRSGPKSSDASSLTQNSWMGKALPGEPSEAPKESGLGFTTLLGMFVAVAVGAGLVVSGIVPLPGAKPATTGAAPTAAVALTSQEVKANNYLKALLEGASDTQRDAAVLLRQMGKPGVNALRQAVVGGNSPAQRHACEALGKMGTMAADAVPELADLVASNAVPQNREAAATALGSMGETAIPKISPMVKNHDPQLRYLGTIACVALGPDCAPLAPQLVRVLQEGDDATRAAASLALGKGGAGVVREIAELLDTTDRDLRRHAADALEKLGPAAAAAVPELVNLLSDKSKGTVDAASRALKNIGRPAAKSLIVRLLGPDQVSTEAKKILKGIGAEAAPDLIEAVGSENFYTRLTVVSLLGDIPSAAKESVPRLEKVLTDDLNEDVRRYAQDSLQKLRR